MSSMILEMQRKALDSKEPVENLVRCALTAAIKLGDKEIVEWALKELKGYENEPLPKYRKVNGVIKCRDPGINGWLPLYLTDSELRVKLEAVSLAQPIAGLRHTSELVIDGDPILQFQIPIEVCQLILSQKDLQKGVTVYAIIGQHVAINIVDHVRNKILEWSLLLEKNDIEGIDFKFTKSEKESASQVIINMYEGSSFNSINVEGSTNVLVAGGQSQANMEVSG